MLKKILLIILCILLTSSLTSCFDVNEVDDLVYVISLGIDKGSQEKLKVTVQYPSLKGGGGQGGSSSGSSEEEYNLLSVEAPTIFSAIDLFNTKITRRFSLMHLKLIVFSEEVAREGLTEYISALNLFREVRYSIPIFISKSGAEKFVLENKSVIGPNPSKTLAFIPERSYSTGFYPPMIHRNFTIDLFSKYTQPVAMLAGISNIDKKQEDTNKEIIEYTANNLPIKGNVKRRVLGTAVFNEDKMVGELNGDETRVFLMAAGEFKGAFMDIKDPLQPDKYINFDVRVQKKPKVKSQIIDDKVFIDLLLYVEPNINDIQSDIDYLETDNLQIIENALKDYIKTTLDSVITKCQNDFGSDIFGFGGSVAKHFYTIQEWEEFEWLEKFKDAEINTKVMVFVRRAGKLQRLSSKTGEGK